MNVMKAKGSGIAALLLAVGGLAACGKEIELETETATEASGSPDSSPTVDSSSTVDGSSTVDSSPTVDSSSTTEAGEAHSEQSGKSGSGSDTGITGSVLDASVEGGLDSCQPVLLISTVPAPAAGLLASIQSSSPSFCTVDYFDANGGTTPTAAYLSQYAAVLAYNDLFNPYADPIGFGDSLATYFNGGGRVVIALFADAGYPIAGAFVTDNYLLLNPLDAPIATDSFSSSDAAQDLVPTSPILTDVISISGTGWRGAQALQNGGVAVADWASGEPLAVVGTVTDGNGNMRNVVDLNILPTDVATGAWTGNGIQLLRNALLYH
jgi:hypothetical protein